MSRRNATVIEASTVRELLHQAWETVDQHGQEEVRNQERIKRLPSVTLVWTEPDNPLDRYPYWDQASEEWYMDIFVRTKLGSPEKTGNPYILPYTYAWRSRYHDEGWGHVWAISQLLNKLNYAELPFERMEDISQLIRETYRYYHPNIVLGVLAWQKRKALETFIASPQVLANIIKTTRSDVIANILATLRNNPETTQNISPSFIYPQLDNYQITTHTPAYQNYQIIGEFNSQGDIAGLSSVHLHRAMNADGSGQLDFAHDLEWGKLIGNKSGLPLKSITIHVNSLYIVTGKTGPEGSTNDDTIASQLLTATGGYQVDKFPVDEYITTAEFQKKVQYLLNQLHSSTPN